VAKKILLSTAAFVLWKNAILCAFSGHFWAFPMWNSGQSLRAAALLSSVADYSHSGCGEFGKEMSAESMERAGEACPVKNQFCRNAGMGNGML
jgi:hypothetical protein